MDHLASTQQFPISRIEPSRGWVSLKLRDLWEYRELLYFLTWRDIKVRYKQTALGAAWALLQPLFTMLIFTLTFSKVAKFPSDGLPYPVFVLAGLVPWTFFVFGLTQSSNSLVGSQNLIKKVYFPRLVVPISSLLSGGVDFLIAFSLLGVIMAYNGIAPTANIIWLPVFLLLTLITSLGVGLWLSALNVQYRDVKYMVPFLAQLWMFATPIPYPSSMILDKFGPFWHALIGLNPMSGVVEGFRWALLGTKTGPGPMIAVSFFVSTVVLISGAFYFRRMEKHFADVV